MKGKLTAKERRRVVLTSIFCFFVIGLSIISSVGNVVSIREKKLEKKELSNQLENLKDEEKTLTDDVEKLKNPEYAARYAREKYLYSKNGEKILKID
ncbi:MAG: septum formation initiator family protein [Bacilli bacterium]|nr:septum formation initiator family protein [Bacilli bacterium]